MIHVDKITLSHFYRLFLAMLTLLSLSLLLGKGFRRIGIPIFVFYHYFLALNIHRDHIQVSVGVLLQPCLKMALFK